MNIKTVMKTVAIATALAFSMNAYAVDQTPDAYSHSYNAGGLASGGEGSVALTGAPVQGVGVYDMTNLSNAAQSFLAFCIAPMTDLVGEANYFATYNVSLTDRFGTARGNSIMALFETSYRSLSSEESKIAFQMALWDLEVDDGHLDSGAQLYTPTDDPSEAVNLAYGMLSAASAHLDAHGSLSTFTYTTFNTLEGAPLSQELMGASIAAVPEADTWAMLATGLGLIGFVGRRRSKKSEKFAA